ncbi:fas-associated death domain protein isoform X2 [Calliopsis andreniformis]|uniref:fas-associated death domain protein isoform X2 n=1 Tax=Calliopsis andreniformis TaxID=337506 RepID=UPI003FCE925C
MTTLMKYNWLCEVVLSAAQLHVDESVLRILKEYYANYINSNRKLSQIRDLRTLLKVLEKRDILSYSNVDPLYHISNYLNDLQVQQHIQDYKLYLQNTAHSSFCDMYKKTNGHETKIKNSTSQSKVEDIELKDQSVYEEKKQATCSEQEEMLQQMILLQVSERIGRSWRDTVRFLGIPEYQIDVIQNKYPFDLKEQSYEALKLCISQYSTDNWKLSLLQALEKARRRDLKELVEKLIICKRTEYNF